jgi:hypothetical protein
MLVILGLLQYLFNTWVQGLAVIRRLSIAIIADCWEYHAIMIVLVSRRRRPPSSLRGLLNSSNKSIIRRLIGIHNNTQLPVLELHSASVQQ